MPGTEIATSDLADELKELNETKTGVFSIPSS